MVITSKRGNLDNIVTYEHICDFTADMADIDPHYITLGSVCTVINGEGGLELYIADSEKQWHSIMAGGGESGNNDDEQSSGSDSKEELLIEKTMELPSNKDSSYFKGGYVYISFEEHNALMSIDDDNDRGKYHIEIIGDPSYYFHADFICYHITTNYQGKKFYAYAKDNMYVQVEAEESNDTPNSYPLRVFFNDHESAINAFELVNSLTIRISKIID